MVFAMSQLTIAAAQIVQSIPVLRDRKVMLDFNLAVLRVINSDRAVKRHCRRQPYAFTAQGVAMLPSVLKRLAEKSLVGFSQTECRKSSRWRGRHCRHASRVRSPR
jgi:hypothetical protein